MLLEILKEVAKKRIERFNLTHILHSHIRLSQPFMNQAVKELRETTNYTIIITEMAQEFTIIVENHKFTVHHRSYKDDSNDYDVEEMVIKYLTKPIEK